MKPLTLEGINKILDDIYAQPLPPRHNPSDSVDFALLHKHGIGYFVDNDGVVLFTSEGMKRAKEVGAIKRATTPKQSPNETQR
jgi:hypothetical protein